jgi:hypothetical protein
MAVLVIALLSAFLAAGIAATTAETGINIAQRGQTRAYNIAQAALEQFMVRRSDDTFCPKPTNCVLDPSIAGVDSEFVRVTVPGGYADVTAMKVRPLVSSTQPALFFVRSRGVDTASKLPGAGRGTFAERTVGVYTAWNNTPIQVLAGWTSLSGLEKNGAAGLISGVDNCPANQGGGAPTVAGLAVPDVPGYDGKISPIEGSPLVDSLGTQAEANAAVKIDWDGIVNRGVLQADVTIPPDAWPTARFASDTSYWPVIFIRGNYAVPNYGRGTLIVTGDLTISGSDMWHGVILVGGAIISNGDNTVLGATISALNEKLGISVPKSTVGNGTKTYVYDSCKLRRAAQRFATYTVYTNTWMDNVAGW